MKMKKDPQTKPSSIKREFILAGLQASVSSINGTQMWRFKWVHTETLTVYETIVDSSYRNYTRNGWDQIVNDPNPWGIYQGLRDCPRSTRRSTPVLTADSYPVKTIQVNDYQDICDILESLSDDHRHEMDYVIKQYEKLVA